MSLMSAQHATGLLQIYQKSEGEQLPPLTDADEVDEAVLDQRDVLLHIDEQLAHCDRDRGVLAHDLEVVVWRLRNTLGVSGAAAARSRARRKASASLCSGGRLSSRKKRRYGSSDLASCTVIEGASSSCVSWQSSTSSPSTSRA